jgi:hypothetical protein
MRQSAVGAVFYALGSKGVITAAVKERIQRAKAKQAVKIGRLFYPMTRKVFASIVSKKGCTVFHRYPSLGYIHCEVWPVPK